MRMFGVLGSTPRSGSVAHVGRGSTAEPVPGRLGHRGHFRTLADGGGDRDHPDSIQAEVRLARCSSSDADRSAAADPPGGPFGSSSDELAVRSKKRHIRERFDKLTQEHFQSLGFCHESHLTLRRYAADQDNVWRVLSELNDGAVSRYGMRSGQSGLTRASK